MAIAGLVFPALLMLLAVTSGQRWLDIERLALFGVPFVIIELIAHYCVIERRKKKGKEDGE